MADAARPAFIRRAARKLISPSGRYGGGGGDPGEGSRMHIPNKIVSEVKAYDRKYRHFSLPRLEISSIHKLKPFKEGSCNRFLWPQAWPHAERHGVYLMLGKNGDVLYIGKASTLRSLGARLGDYFPDKTSKKVRFYWKHWTPHYVITVAVPQDNPFEAASLEEYLVSTLCPEHNTVGKKRRT